jgi:hypothetical protein
MPEVFHSLSPIAIPCSQQPSEQYCSDFTKIGTVGYRLEALLWSPKPCTKQF